MLDECPYCETPLPRPVAGSKESKRPIVCPKCNARIPAEC